MPKILILRYEGVPFAIRMSKVIRTVLETGWQCDVLIPKGGLGATNISREMGWDLTRRVNIIEFPQIASHTPRLWSRLSGEALFGTPALEDTLVDLLRSGTYDALMVKDSQCLKRAFAARQRAGLPDLPILCDMYENATAQMYDYLIRFGNWRQRIGAVVRGLVSRLSSIERRYLPKCRHIFVVVEEARDFLIQRYGVNPEQISVIHNVEFLADMDGIEPPPQPLVPDGVPLVSYVGSLGPHRGIEVLLDAVQATLQRATSPFKMVIVGAREEQRRTLQASCGARGLTDTVQIHGYLPHRQAMQWIKRTDIGIIPHHDTPFIRTTIPNKLFQYMGAGALCLVSDVGPLSRIVRECDCGLVFGPGSAIDLSEQLLAALSNPTQVQAMGARGRSCVEKRYCWEIEGRAYAAVLNRLVDLP